MPKIKLVKAIVRYIPFASGRNFVQGDPTKIGSARYLLLQKAKDEFHKENIGKWEFVGGMIKPKETSRQAIIREMTEETGLEYEVNYLVVKKLPTLKSNESICDVYLINASETDINHSDEHSDHFWFKREEIQKTPLVRYADMILEFFNDAGRYLV